MQKIKLDNTCYTGVTIMIFVEGTILKPKEWWSLYNHKSYVPIGNSVAITKTWQQQGANIYYCTSRKKKQAIDIANLLKKYEFSGSFLIAREQETYKNIVEKIKPNILIEDDCKSIGGAWQMCITKVVPEVRANINAITVPEFKGIDSLPVDIRCLEKYQSSIK